MSFSVVNRIIASAVVAAAALVVFNPATFWATEKYIGQGKGYLAQAGHNHTAAPQIKGYLLHAVVMMIIVFALLSIDWNSH